MTDPQTTLETEQAETDQTPDLAVTALVEEVSIDKTGEPASAVLVEEVSIDGMCGVY